MNLGLLDTYDIISPAIATAGVYFFTTDNGLQYEVRFGRRQDNILHATIVFGVINEEFEGEEYIITNKGELYRVMATIVHVVRMFMEQHPKMLTFEFTGISKADEDENRLSQRFNLYKRYLPKIFDTKKWSFNFNLGNTVTVNKI